MLFEGDMANIDWVRFESRYVNDFKEIVNGFEIIVKKRPVEYYCPFRIAKTIHFNAKKRCVIYESEDNGITIIPVEKIIDMGKE